MMNMTKYLDNDFKDNDDDIKDNDNDIKAILNQPQLGVDLIPWTGSSPADERLHAWYWRWLPLPWNQQSST